jgi:hypothetical protein
LKEVPNVWQIKTIHYYSGNRSYLHPIWDDTAELHPEDRERLPARSRTTGAKVQPLSF